VSPPLLVATVAAVGLLHTLVPDHWAPIVVLARQQGWSVLRTARAAAIAGIGHVTTTLLLGVLLWAVGAVLAVRYAHVVSVVAAVALLGFGLWIAYGGWRELQAEGNHADGHSHRGHAHGHRHADSTQHVHWHEHHSEDWHAADGGTAVVHEHDHATSGRTALLLILGSSPMIEGIPAFLAASPYGVPLVSIMAVVFAASTIATYVGVSVAGIAGFQRISLGPLERYGEVASGVFVALVGVYALVTA
jgi:ABC-type nickel/cobalt efflux system permease component RcnA